MDDQKKQEIKEYQEEVLVEGNEEDQFEQTYSIIIGLGWLVTLVFSLVYLTIGLVFYFGQWFDFPNSWYEWPISYFLGAMVNFIAFTLLKNHLGNLSKDSKRRSAAGNYIIRFALYGFFLYLAFDSSRLNPFIVASGYLTIRIAILIYTLSRKEKKAK